MVPGRLARLLGRRGTVLAALGVIFVAHGVAVLTAPEPPFGGSVALGLDGRPWGWLWIGCGALAAAVSPRRASQGRVGVRAEAAGYTALLLPPAVWALLHAWSWAAHLVGLAGNPRGWAAAVVWATLIVIVLVVAGWPEPPEER